MIEISFWVFIVSAGILTIFYALTTLVIGRYNKPAISSETVSGISIIVCAKNELEHLQKLIPTLLSQDYATFEIILIDDKSSDQTYDYAIALMQQEKRFKLVRIDHTPDHIHNKKYAITLGIKAAQYDKILLTDADCLPAGNSWISEMNAGFSHEKIQFVLGFSQYYQEEGFLNRFIRFETLLTAQSYVGLGLLGKPYMGVGRNLAYRKSYFLSKNGFGKHQKIIGGDDDLFVNSHSRRSSTSIVLSAESTVYSYPKKTWGEFLLQKTRHLSIGKYYKVSDQILLGLIILAKIIFWASLGIACFAFDKTIYTAIGFFLTMATLMSSLHALSKKTGEGISLWRVPLLDFSYIIYYISISLKVLFTKKIKWR